MGHSLQSPVVCPVNPWTSSPALPCLTSRTCILEAHSPCDPQDFCQAENLHHFEIGPLTKVGPYVTVDCPDVVPHDSVMFIALLGMHAVNSQGVPSRDLSISLATGVQMFGSEHVKWSPLCLSLLVPLSPGCVLP